MVVLILLVVLLISVCWFVSLRVVVVISILVLGWF